MSPDTLSQIDNLPSRSTFAAFSLCILDWSNITPTPAPDALVCPVLAATLLRYRLTNRTARAMQKMRKPPKIPPTIPAMALEDAPPGSWRLKVVSVAIGVNIHGERKYLLIMGAMSMTWLS